MKTNNQYIVYLSVIFGISLMLLLVKRTYAQSIPTISSRESYEMQKSGQAIIVDVRELDEIAKGKIKNAHVLPMSLMTSSRDKFDKEVGHFSKDKEIHVYCRSGRRSGIVGAFLQEKGFKVKNLGGFADWEKAGLEIEK